ncbi:hypothetical protein QQP08_015848, partial [Theobroma cacao]
VQSRDQLTAEHQRGRKNEKALRSNKEGKKKKGGGKAAKVANSRTPLGDATEGTLAVAEGGPIPILRLFVQHLCQPVMKIWKLSSALSAMLEIPE